MLGMVEASEPGYTTQLYSFNYSPPVPLSANVLSFIDGWVVKQVRLGAGRIDNGTIEADILGATSIILQTGVSVTKILDFTPLCKKSAGLSLSNLSFLIVNYSYND